MADELSQYNISNGDKMPENLPLDSRFAQKMSRGGMGNPNMYMTSEQQDVIKRYIPATCLSKDERVVYNIISDITDVSGTAPTVTQIASISAARAETGAIGMEAEGFMKGLTPARVQRALNKLQQCGFVSQMV